ncbi:hypothetical protein B0H34DRAFT_796223 [Crassisporium funariophilum]|nr:hypothetical protein B0H34DRAFT_796223 [Crassisporium funariophilum]
MAYRNLDHTAGGSKHSEALYATLRRVVIWPLVIRIQQHPDQDWICISQSQDHEVMIIVDSSDEEVSDADQGLSLKDTGSLPAYLPLCASTPVQTSSHPRSSLMAVTPACCLLKQKAGTLSTSVRPALHQLPKPPPLSFAPPAGFCRLRKMDGSTMSRVRDFQHLQNLDQMIRPSLFGLIVDSALLSFGFSHADIERLDTLYIANPSQEAFVNAACAEGLPLDGVLWDTYRMSRSQKDNTLCLQHYKQAGRRLKSKHKRQKWRTPKAHPRIKPTPHQKQAALYEEAAKLHSLFGRHLVNHYHQLLIQTSAAKSRTRKVNRWNAYSRSKVKRLNKELPVGEKKKALYHVGAISRRWNAMTLDEQKAVTDHLLEDIEELCEMKKTSVRNVPIEAFGTEVILLAVCSDPHAYLRPFTVVTSEKGSSFVSLTTKVELSSLAIKFEGYCVSGAEGLVCSHTQEVLQLKTLTAALIKEKLCEFGFYWHTFLANFGPESASKTHVASMNYANFDNAITAHHGIVLKGWPLRGKFIAPGKLNTRNELKVLYNTFSDGQAKFRLMSNTEWEEWLEKRTARTANNNPSPSPSPRSTPEPSPSQPQPSHMSSSINNNTSSPAAQPSEMMQGAPPATPPSTSNITSETRGDKCPSSKNSSQASKKRKQVPLQDTFINTGVTDVGGQAIITQPKKRKERSDKGKPRGSRKKATSSSM